TAKLLQELATIQLSGNLPSTVSLLCYWELASEGFNPLPQAPGFTLEPTPFTGEALLDNPINILLGKHLVAPGLLLTTGWVPSSSITGVDLAAFYSALKITLVFSGVPSNPFVREELEINKLESIHFVTSDLWDGARFRELV